MFLERKILGRLLGGEVYRDFCALGGWNDLRDAVDNFGADSPLTALNPTLNDVDPDGNGCWSVRSIYILGIASIHSIICTINASIP